MIHRIFKNKTIIVDKLISYGFTEDCGVYVFRTQIVDGQFEMLVEINLDGEVSTILTDTCTQEPYTLHLVESAEGAFVGSVRSEYERVLSDIADCCFEKDVFKSSQARSVIQFIRQKYGDEFEFLWEKFSQNAISRRKDNKKWYAILMVLSKRKLALDSDEIFDILDVRAEPEVINSLVDNKKYFSGYHMNKKHWITVCLDGSLSDEQIFGLINKSYELAKKS